jgi:trans-aconitate methyltransferase
MDAAMYEAHEKLEDRHWWFEGRRRVIGRVLATQLLPCAARRILDVGCGTGGMFPLLARFGAVQGAESSADARARAQRRFPLVPVSPCELPATLPQGRWDLITAFDVIEHVEEAVQSLQCLRARLAPGGQLVVTVPAFQFLWSHHDEVNQHKRRYTRRSLETQLEAAGFAVTFASYFNSLLFPAVAGVRVLQRLLPSRAAGHEDPGDLTPTFAPLNFALTALFGAEARLLPGLRLPAGVSLVAVASSR